MTQSKDPLESAETDPGDRVVVPWSERDRALEAKLAALYRQHLDGWISLQGDHKFEQKWHVGRAMLDWFYSQHLIDADEFEALNGLYSRPSKPGYDIEMYRIIWKASGRSSPQVAAISLAPHMGPRPGYQRGAIANNQLAAVSSATSQRSSALSPLKAELEFKYGDGGWLYGYGYEEALRHSAMLGELPLVKIGHTKGEYADRIWAQVRGTEIPDAPRILRAYRVVDSVSVEAEVHRRLKAKGMHHRRAGGSEWFRVDVAYLDELVKQVANLAAFQPSE